jgi:hypothetical protein
MTRVAQSRDKVDRPSRGHSGHTLGTSSGICCSIRATRSQSLGLERGRVARLAGLLLNREASNLVLESVLSFS